MSLVSIRLCLRLRLRLRRVPAEPGTGGCGLKRLWWLLDLLSKLIVVCLSEWPAETSGLRLLLEARRLGVKPLLLWLEPHLLELQCLLLLLLLLLL